MALSATERRSIRRAFPKRRCSSALITLIDSGASGDVSYLNERTVATCFGRKTKAAGLLTNLQTGTATSTATQKSLAQVMARTRTAAGIATKVDALS